MSSSNLSISNVTVDKSVNTAEGRVPIPTPINIDLIINFKTADISNIVQISADQTLSMAKSGVAIVDYTKGQGISVDIFRMLFGAENTPRTVEQLISMFKLSSTTPSRLIRVIRTGIDAMSPIAETVLGITADVAPTAIKYILFRINGVGDDTKTSPFITYSDWSFVVSLENSIINGKTDRIVVFNVLV